MTADDGTLLVVDDELFLRGAVAASLRFLGFEVDVAENGTDALRLARNNAFDLLILDVVLPDIDGFEIVRRLRGEGSRVPVIFLTAKDTQDDKVTGLTIGGDDYMTKPFGLEELAARVRTVLRRTRPVPAEPVLTFADLTLDQDTYEVRRGGRLIELSPTEFRLLRYFMLNPGRVLTRAQLLDHVDQVARTIDKVEVIVTTGSIAVVLLIGLGVFLVLRRGLRPIEAMAGQADRITAGLHEREASQQQMRLFFADASHELRTPLASLRANAELYQQGALRSTDEVDEVMERIVLETRRMGRLVDDMLRLARLGQHPGRSAEPVDVTAAVTGCAERAQIADPERTWRVRIADGLGLVGDEELLRRAVDNLLMNVLVHTPAGTVGTITASAAGDRVVVEVSDDGPGVPPDKLPHIFERFYRAASQGTRGSGLGLAIAAEIAAAHGGAALAAPAAPRGLRVVLTLAAGPPPDRRRAVRQQLA